MTIGIVRRVIALGQPAWFGVWYLAEGTEFWCFDEFLLTFDGPDLKACVSWC